MAASATDIASLRLMIADPGNYFSDDFLTDVIEKYPLDSGYDLNAAARDLWELKAASYAAETERFTADGKSFDFGSLLDKAMKMRNYFAGKASQEYSANGFGYFSRDDVDPLGNGDNRTRPLI